MGTNIAIYFDFFLIIQKLIIFVTIYINLWDYF